MELQKVLLIGAGRFGAHYARHLVELDSRKEIDFLGVVVKTKDSALALESKSFPVHTSLSQQLLNETDQFFIVTPPETHYELALECLEYGDVFVEKPLAYQAREIEHLKEVSEQFDRRLTVGHLFRLHPVTTLLKESVSSLGVPKKVIGKFVNPIEEDQKRMVSHELLHWFDVIDYLWEGKVTSKRIDEVERILKILLSYDNGLGADLELGWAPKEKQRYLEFKYPDKIVVADYLKDTVIVDGVTTKVQTEKCDPLRGQIEAVIYKSQEMVKVDTALKIQKIADVSSKPEIRKKVAVIGGGIFGTSVALELDACDVTIFEKNNSLLKEGAYINQFRHHYGYHYPRSDETVVDIQRSKKLFESLYGGAIDTSIPTYYAVAIRESKVSPQEFLQFCKKHSLPVEPVEEPVFNPESVSMTLKVPEPSYHYETLYRLINERILSSDFITVNTNAEVVDANILKNGKKRLTVSKNDGVQYEEEFDFVVNSTYASINSLVRALGFEPIPIRVDVAEVLIVDIPIEPISLTVIDGPFATLMSTGNKNEFTLYHVTESILDRYVPEDGCIRPSDKTISNKKSIFEESRKFFPQLDQATVKTSRIVRRGVQAGREYDDNRVAELFVHGAGCYSILSGKILSSAYISKQVKRNIQQDT